MKITIRLRPDRDDDIKEWYQSLPCGDRSRIIRDVLKDFINHKEEIGPNHFLDKGKGYADTDSTGVKLKTNNVDDYDDNKIDSKLDDLLDQI